MRVDSGLSQVKHLGLKMTVTCSDSGSLFVSTAPHPQRSSSPPLSFLCGLLHASFSTGVPQGLASASAPRGDLLSLLHTGTKVWLCSPVQGSEPRPAASCVKPPLGLSWTPARGFLPPRRRPYRTPARAELKHPPSLTATPHPDISAPCITPSLSQPFSELQNQATTSLHCTLARQELWNPRAPVSTHRTWPLGTALLSLLVKQAEDKDVRHLWWVYQEQLHCYRSSRKMHVNKHATMFNWITRL